MATMNDDNIPEMFRNSEYKEVQSGDMRYVINKSSGCTSLLYCKEINKWCTGRGAPNEPFTCDDCEHFFRWIKRVKEEKENKKNSVKESESQQKIKVNNIDLDGDLIPDYICKENLIEKKNRHGHVFLNENDSVYALKCPYLKNWCKGTSDKSFTCVGCPHYEGFALDVIDEVTKPDDFVKNDSGKLEWSLMPFKQLEDVVRVLMFGAKKYSRDNWKKCDDVNRYKDALMRHVTAYIEGEKFDKGKGGDNLPHLAHAICNCLFLLWFDQAETEEWEKFIEVTQKA